MNYLQLAMKFKTRIASFLIVFAACFLVLSPIGHAVSPPPDGGYAGGNTAKGQGALLTLTSGGYNTAVGLFSLRAVTTGSNNTGVGTGTLLLNSVDNNTAVGAGALLNNITGPNNTATGVIALFGNTVGTSNTADGVQALGNNTIGNGNTAGGVVALVSNISGNNNTAYGLGALLNNSTGSNNIALGVYAGNNVTGVDNVICIGTPGLDVSNSCFIGQIYSNVQPIVGTDPDSVTVTSSGRLGRGNVSSRRYKHDIKLMDKASEALYALKPVTFRYNKEYDAAQTLAFGLIAEEVAEVYPDLVGRNSKGEPESVRYEQINAMLLNEFLKEHRKVEQLAKDFEAKFVEQQRQIEALTAGLHRVRAQVPLSKAAPNVASTKR
jgi:hypothetical protein